MRREWLSARSESCSEESDLRLDARSLVEMTRRGRRRPETCAPDTPHATLSGDSFGDWLHVKRTLRAYGAGAAAQLRRLSALLLAQLLELLEAHAELHEVPQQSARVRNPRVRIRLPT